jgi:hypothetical protein
MNYELENMNNDNINNINNDIDMDINVDITWDDPATPLAQPVQPVIAPNGWHWYPDINGNLFSLYFDQDGNECMVWMQNDDGSFYWRCADVGYNCREIGIEGRRGIFFQDLLVGTMILDEDLTVTWLPETYIPETQIQLVPNDYINQINYNINYNINIDLNDIYDSDSEEDDTNDP